jgi:phosphoglycolate phosphatase
MLKNAFFDLDGTLADSREGILKCLRFSLDKLECPCSADPDLQHYIGVPLRNIYKELLNTADRDLIEKAVSLYRERYEPTGIFEQFIYPGIPALLEALQKASITAYVVTAKARVSAQIIIKHYQLDRWFQGVYGPGLDGRLDSKSELVRFALQELKINPGETVMVGDKKEDILAGKANDLKTIWATYGFGSESELIGLTPDYICHTPEEIRKVITGK